MEFINEYIGFSLLRKDNVNKTYCTASHLGRCICIEYSLSDQECIFDFSKKYNYIRLEIDNKYFEKYHATYHIKNVKQHICCNTQSKLYDFISCNLDGISKSIYLESIVLFLIYQLQKNDLIYQLHCNSCSFVDRPNELDKIQKAKEFILSNMDKNITIPQLAKNVGTNECYLKKGFKEIYGQTIYEFVTDNRMQKAKSLLMHTSLSISEVSLAVGYSNMSSFIQAFKNYFNITPGQIMKSAQLT